MSMHKTEEDTVFGSIGSKFHPSLSAPALFLVSYTEFARDVTGGIEKHGP